MCCKGLNRTKPSGGSSTTTNILILVANFFAETDIIVIPITASNAGTYTVQTQDGASGDITFSFNGIDYAAFASPMVLDIGDTLYIKRSIFAAAGFVQLDGEA